MRNTTILAALALTACAGWNNLPSQDNTSLDKPLWNPAGVVPSEHGVYVPLTESGGLALVTAEGPNGTADRIDLGEGRLTRLTASPSGDTLVAFVERVMCDYSGDDKPPNLVDDCPEDDRIVTTELDVVRGKKVESSVALSGSYNAIAYADDGRYAIAYLDFSDPQLLLDGVINLTSVVVLDLTTGETTPVSGSTNGFTAASARWLCVAPFEEKTRWATRLPPTWVWPGLACWRPRRFQTLPCGASAVCPPGAARSPRHST